MRVSVNVWVIVAVFSIGSFCTGIVVQATQCVLPCMGDCGCKSAPQAPAEDPEPPVRPGPEV